MAIVFSPKGGGPAYGSAPSGGGGSSGGGNQNWLQDAAAAYAQQREGYRPHRVMQEGTVTYQNGVPGIFIKYDTPQGSSTEWTPISGAPAGTGNAPMYEWGAQGGGGVYGGAGGAGGFGEEILSNPYYQQVLAAVNAAAAADAAGRRTGIQQALISFGEAPAGFADKYNDIDALTRELAAKNTSSGISSKARLVQSKADAIRMFSRAQAARGLRRSGNKGWGLRKRQLEFDQGYSDAVGKLLGYTGSLYSTFANNEYNRALQLASAALTASQMSDFGGGGGGGGGGLATNNFVPGTGIYNPGGPDYYGNQVQVSGPPRPQTPSGDYTYSSPRQNINPRFLAS